MKKIYFLILLSAICSCPQAQVMQWAKQFTGVEVFSKAIARDASGNVYITGYFYGTVDFDPGPATFNLTAVVGYQVFVCKLDAAGNFVWAKQFGATTILTTDVAIAVDASGNVYTTGTFGDNSGNNIPVDFDPGPAIFNLTPFGLEDVFVSKLDAAGNFVWAKQLGGTSIDRGASIAVDASGNVYTTGIFSGTADFDPGPANFNLTSTGLNDAFICKLDATGNFVWAKRFGGGTGVQAYGASIAVDVSGNVYTTGGFDGATDFDPGPATFNLTPTGTNDAFISKLDATGNFVWAKRFGGGTGVYTSGSSIAVDASGNVYTTGDFNGTVDFDPGAATFNLTSAGQYDVFISKLDAAGNFVWAKGLGGTDDESGYSIAVDASGNVYTTGYFSGTVDFDPGAATFNLTPFGLEDVFVSKLDAAGNFVWAVQLGGTDYDEGYSITLDASGNVYTTGNFGGTADFDPCPGTFNLTTTASTGNPFVHKISQAVTAPIVTPDATACSGSNSGTLTLTGYSGSIFRWESSTDNFVTIITIANTTATQNYSNLTQTTKYRAVVQNGTCAPFNSAAATITVTNGTVAGAVSSNATVCSGSNAGTLTLSGHAGNILRWESSVDNFVTIVTIANTTTTQNYSNLIVTTKYRAVVQNGTCTATNSTPATITVTNGTVAGTVGSDATVCSGSNSGTLTLSGHAGNILRWESSVDNFVTTTTIANTTTTQNYSNLTQTTKYRAVVQNGTCTATNSTPATITVINGTVAGAVGSDATVCSGNNSGILTLSGHAGNILRWESSVDNFVTIVTIANTTTTQNYSNLTVTTKYRAVVQNGTCTATNSTPATITVTNGTTAGAVSSDAAVCSGSNAGILTLSGYAGNILRWESSTDNFATITTIANTTTTQNYLNLTQTTKYRAVVQNGTCTSSNSAAATITVTLANGGTPDQFVVSPNPSNGQLRITYYNQVNEQMTLTVYDLKGSKMYQQKLLSGQSPCLGTRVEIDLSHVLVTGGLYFAELRGANGSSLSTKRFIIFHP